MMVAISAFSSLLPFCTALRIPAHSPSLAFRKEEPLTSDQQPVVVPVSLSNTLTKFFQLVPVLLRPSAVCYNACVKTHLIIDSSITGLILFPLSLILLQNKHQFHFDKQQILAILALKLTRKLFDGQVPSVGWLVHVVAIRPSFFKKIQLYGALLY